MNIAIIGCGGTGGWAAQLLAKTLTEDDTLILWDKDVFEERNMERQLMCKPGTFKAHALQDHLTPGSRATIQAITETWFTGDLEPLGSMVPDALFCCVDNHPARLRCLEFTDQRPESLCLVAGNEYDSFEARVYRACFENHERLDPRKLYPELLTSHAGDPLQSCTGVVLEASPQLALANMQAAAAMCRLWYFWTFKMPELGFNARLDHPDPDTREALLPTIEVAIRGTSGSLTTHKLKGPA